MEIIILIVVVLLLAIVGFRTANHNYTIGSGLFKHSHENLKKDEHLDPSDYNFYDDDGKLK